VTEGVHICEGLGSTLGPPARSSRRAPALSRVQGWPLKADLLTHRVEAGAVNGAA
jgi:hypothetical protein